MPLPLPLHLPLHTQELDRALELCAKHGLGALLDMHAWVGSQNGLDNSGETKCAPQ